MAAFIFITSYIRELYTRVKPIMDAS